MPRLDKDTEVRRAIAAARAAIPSNKRDVLVFDSGHKRVIPGFGVRVFKSGHSSFILKYVVGKGPHARTRRMALGAVSANGLDKQLVRLRQMAEEIRDNGRVLGRDLIGEKQAEAAAKAAADRERLNAPTLSKLAPEYIRDRDRGKNAQGRQLRRLKARSLIEVERYLIGSERTPSVWEPIANTPLSRITMQDLKAILQDVANTKGSVTADRARVALSSFYSWAIDLGHTGANPTNDIAAYSRNEPRERVLDEGELVDIWKACADDDHGRIVRLLILTGQRRAEIGDLEWREIDANKRQIDLPPRRSKNGLPHIIPLSDEALALLPDKNDERDLVFGIGAGGFSGWSKAKRELDDRISAARRKAQRDPMPPWVLHDLRRSFVTHIADSGIAQPHIIEAAINHVSGHKGGVAGIYNKATYLAERRDALQRWAAHIRGLVDTRTLRTSQSAKPGNKRKSSAVRVRGTAA